MKREQCDEISPLLYIESYAFADQVVDLKLDTCGKGRSYIVVRTLDGKTICSPCLEERAVVLSARFIEHYKTNAKIVT